MAARTKPAGRPATALSRFSSIVGAIAIATGIGAAAVTGIASAATTAGHDRFSNQPLSPGSVAHAHILVPSGSKSYRPYLAMVNLADTCHLECRERSHPQLSSLLTVSATAPDGTAWRGDFDDLQTPVALTGGILPAHSPSRLYDVVVSLPRQADNDSEGLSTSFDMRWGVMDANGKPVTSVLGVAVTRHPGGDSHRSGDGQSAGSSLPFTGFDTVMGLVAALALIGSGLVLLLAGRERWRIRLGT